MEPLVWLVSGCLCSWFLGSSLLVALLVLLVAQLLPVCVVDPSHSRASDVKPVDVNREIHPGSVPGEGQRWAKAKCFRKGFLYRF